MRLVACRMLLALVGILASASAPAALGQAARWHKGNTHTHTINSDGDSTPDEVARWYRTNGYQFVFITDHENLTEVDALNRLIGAEGRFLILPGQEITQGSLDPERAAAHVNSLFASRLIWPLGRLCAGPDCGLIAPAEVSTAELFSRNIDLIRRSNAIAQVNHPNWLWSLRPEDLDAVPDGILIEVWNGIAHVNNLGGATEEGDVRPSAEGFWDYLLSRGKIIWGVGSDDSHIFKGGSDPIGLSPGRAWIMVRARELTEDALRRAIESGEFYASTGVALENIEADETRMSITIADLTLTDPRMRGLNLSPRFTTRFIGQDGELLAIVSGRSPAYRFRPDDQYVRAVVSDSNGNQAWTQPVFMDGRRASSPYHTPN